MGEEKAKPTIAPFLDEFIHDLENFTSANWEDRDAYLPSNSAILAIQHESLTKLAKLINERRSDTGCEEYLKSVLDEHPAVRDAAASWLGNIR